MSTSCSLVKRVHPIWPCDIDLGSRLNKELKYGIMARRGANCSPSCEAVSTSYVDVYTSTEQKFNRMRVIVNAGGVQACLPVIVLGFLDKKTQKYLDEVQTAFLRCQE